MCYWNHDGKKEEERSTLYGSQNHFRILYLSPWVTQRDPLLFCGADTIRRTSQIRKYVIETCFC